MCVIGRRKGLPHGRDLIPPARKETDASQVGDEITKVADPGVAHWLGDHVHLGEDDDHWFAQVACHVVVEGCGEVEDGVPDVHDQAHHVGALQDAPQLAPYLRWGSSRGGCSIGVGNRWREKRRREEEKEEEKEEGKKKKHRGRKRATSRLCSKKLRRLRS